jgi:hypothetical protein
MTVTGGVRGVAGVATVGSCEAVPVRGVAFDEVALWDAVEGKKELVEVRFFQSGAGGFDEGLDVPGFLVVRGKQGSLQVGGVTAY